MAGVAGVAGVGVAGGAFLTRKEEGIRNRGLLRMPKAEACMLLRRTTGVPSFGTLDSFTADLREGGG